MPGRDFGRKEDGMWTSLHQRRGVQLALGLGMGILFGFLLQKGQVARYEKIVGQLLLRDFTVLKVMMSAAATGMIGVYALRRAGKVRLHAKPGTVGSTVIGGLIFGCGMALLGYCPGTAAAAVGQGSMDALLGGFPGMLAGAMIYAAIYPRISRTILNKGDFGDVTLPQALGITESTAVLGVWAVVATGFLALELLGL